VASSLDVYTRRVSFNEKMYLAINRIDPRFCIQIALEDHETLNKFSLFHSVEYLVIKEFVCA